MLTCFLYELWGFKIVLETPKEPPHACKGLFIVRFLVSFLGVNQKLITKGNEYNLARSPGLPIRTHWSHLVPRGSGGQLLGLLGQLAMLWQCCSGVSRTRRRCPPDSQKIKIIESLKKKRAWN